MSPQQPPRLASELGDVGLARLLVLLLEKVRHLVPALVHYGRDDVRGRLPGELQDVLAEVRLHYLDAGPLQRMVEVAFLGDHGLGLHRFARAVPPGDLAHDAVYVLTRLGPVDRRSASGRVTLELLQVEVETGECAIANRRGGAADFLVVTELRDALGAPAHEIALQSRERRLQLCIGELAARRRLEVHGSRSE